MTLYLTDQLIAKLQFLHTQNILHRNIKLKNFLLRKDKSKNIVYITNLDLALDQVKRSHTTSSLIGPARFIRRR